MRKKGKETDGRMEGGGGGDISLYFYLFMQLRLSRSSRERNICSGDEQTGGGSATHPGNCAGRKEEGRGGGETPEEVANEG